jgi:two-component system NarL family response regulator
MLQTKDCIAIPFHSSCKLSARELEILKLLAEGHTNSEISDQLYVSTSTVKTHIRGILNKFGVNHRIQAAVLAVRQGLI